MCSPSPIDRPAHRATGLRLGLGSAGLALAGLGLTGPAAALGPGPQGPDTRDVGAASGRPRASFQRLEEGRSIQLDGRVGADEWRGAGQLGPLTQVVPVEGAPPSHPTEVHLFQDGRTLYVGLVCHDDPAEVRARQMDRDAFVQFDDVVEIWFDTFRSQQSAYWFQITAAGSRGDSLLSDGGQRFNKSWDGIWDGRAARTERGWEAELAIPLQSLAFDSSLGSFGFNLRRKRVANGEVMRWASPSIAYRFFRLSEGGIVGGLDDLEQGLGLQLTPYLRADLDRPRWDALEPSARLGGDISFRPTPESNLLLTFGTDFAETEVDDRQVNLTRFPLFFPEKRDFFLEDAALFEFGAPSNRSSIVPFFSRTIGRDGSGAALDLLAGAKFSARSGPWTLGLLDVQVAGWDGSDGQRIEEKNLAVARAARQLGEEGSVGAIVTGGLPGASGEAVTAGVDLRLQDARLFGEGRSGSLWAWALASSREEDGEEAIEGDAFGLEARARTREWDLSLEAERVGTDFDPAMGFVRRAGVTNLRHQTRYLKQLGDTGWLRRFDARVAVDVTRDLDGNEDNYAIPIQPVGLQLQSGDEFEWEVHRIVEQLDDPFLLGGQVEVAAGRYEMTRHFLQLESNDRRRVKAEVELEFGDFYGGDITRWTISPFVIPNEHWRAGLEWTQAQGRLPAGDYDLAAWQLNLDLSFTPDLSWKNLLQYDTGSEQLGFQSRMRWILTPGQDLFLVGQGGWLQRDGERLVAQGQALAVKLTWAVRF